MITDAFHNPDKRTMVHGPLVNQRTKVKSSVTADKDKTLQSKNMHNSKSTAVPKAFEISKNLHY